LQQQTDVHDMEKEKY